jgi:hypothetical protein
MSPTTAGEFHSLPQPNAEALEALSLCAEVITIGR